MNRIILSFILSATFLLGLYGFVQTPYYALALGDVELYYRLKAVPLAVDACENFLADDVAMDMCTEVEVIRIARELRR